MTLDEKIEKILWLFPTSKKEATREIMLLLIEEKIALIKSLPVEKAIPKPTKYRTTKGAVTEMDIRINEIVKAEEMGYDEAKDDLLEWQKEQIKEIENK